MKKTHIQLTSLGLALLLGVGSLSAAEPKTPNGKTLKRRFHNKMDKLKTEDGKSWYFDLDSLAEYLTEFDLEAASNGEVNVDNVKANVSQQVFNRLRQYIPLPADQSNPMTHLTDQDINAILTITEAAFEGAEDNLWKKEDVSNNFTLIQPYAKPDLSKFVLFPVTPSDPPVDKDPSKKGDDLFKKIAWGTVGAGIIWFIYTNWTQQQEEPEAAPTA